MRKHINRQSYDSSSAVTHQSLALIQTCNNLHPAADFTHTQPASPPNLSSRNASLAFAVAASSSQESCRSPRTSEPYLEHRLGAPVRMSTTSHPSNRTNPFQTHPKRQPEPQLVPTRPATASKWNPINLQDGAAATQEEERNDNNTASKTPEMWKGSHAQMIFGKNSKNRA